MDGVIIRELVPGDYNYIISTWLRELRLAAASPLSDSEWFDSHRKFVDRCLGSTNLLVKVMCPADDHNEILGYIIGNDRVIIWAHTKRAFRRMGISKQLIGEICQNQLNLSLAFWTKHSKYLPGRVNPIKCRVV